MSDMTDAAVQQHTQHELHVEVFSPREPHPKPFAWPKTLTVGQAAQQAATAFGYVSGNPTLQNSVGDALDRSLTLEQAGIHDGDKLEVIDAGGGV
jgi:hypothetical protein